MLVDLGSKVFNKCQKEIPAIFSLSSLGLFNNTNTHLLVNTVSQDICQELMEYYHDYLPWAAFIVFTTSGDS